ncbi:hypothetical protein D3C87_460090 [compost metagenome]
MSRANFTDEGLAIGQNNVNMTYMYGLSDFFTMMFEDTAKLNLLLEAESEGASDIYSRFLQLTSSISLESIQETIGSAIQLVTIKSTDAVEGQVNVYKLNTKITSSRYLANRPFLPTLLMESEVDYRIELNSDGTYQVRFARAITECGFSTRTGTDGTTKEFAVWFVDANLDEQLIYTMFGSLIGVDPAASTDAYYNFVYGLYYVYVHGPTLDLLRKGLNLTLGIPLARSDETVLTIRQYLETDQYIVITDQNQYIIPYGLPPIVEEGDTLKTGDELAQWVEIKDYINDGDWWINLQIPSSVIPSLPAGQIDRYATAGSHFDDLMRNYLKKHTFLVNVKVQDFKNIQTFQQLSDIINKAKPTYTQPIYVWSIASLDETLTITDDLSTYRLDPSRCDHLNWPIDKMYRANTDAPLMRGCPTFIRCNVPQWVSKLGGTDEYINGNPVQMEGLLVDGFVNQQHGFRANTDQEKAWMKTLFQRGHAQYRSKRSKVARNRGSQSTSAIDGTAVDWYDVPVGMRVVPIYTTKQYDIAAKCQAVGTDVPPMTQWVFTIFDPASNSEAINQLAINESSSASNSTALIDNFNTLFFRGANVAYLGALIPQLGYQTYAPDVADVKVNDYLMGIRILEDTVGIYWVTSSQIPEAPQYFPVDEMDVGVLTYEMPITRNHSAIGVPYYNLRGVGTLNYNNGSGAYNGQAINEGTEAQYDLPAYRDKYNTAGVTMNRSGVKIVHAQELK